MPELSSPRIFDFLILKLPFGINVPIFASTTLMPSLAFEAPQTICNISDLVFTLHNFNLSASGCGFASRISATSKAAKSAARSSISSTSRPVIVRVFAICSKLASVSRNCLSHDMVNLIAQALLQVSVYQAHQNYNDLTSAGRLQKTRVNHECHILTLQNAPLQDQRQSLDILQDQY